MKSIFFYVSSVVFTLILFSTNSLVFAAEYKALEGLNQIKVVFDVRQKSIKAAALQIDLIHQTYHEQNIRTVSESPQFVLVFAGRAVKLASTDRDEYTDEEQMLLDLIADKLKAMKKDGIRLEICLFASDVYDVEPGTILPSFQQVDNGWISLIGYQANGYSLVSVF